MQKPGATILCYLALTACTSGLFWALMIASGHVGAGNGSYVAGLMWCPAVAAVATVYIRRLDFKMLGLRWGGARYAIENSAISIDHLDAISDEEISMLAASDTIGVVTPTVNFNFGSTEFADARKMIDAGCAIALSTDFNPGSAPCPSLPNAMAIACRYQKLLPAEALIASTINAAHAVGLGEKAGSIALGKQADLLVLDTTDYRQLAFEFGGNLVQQVIKNGKNV